MLLSPLPLCVQTACLFQITRNVIRHPMQDRSHSSIGNKTSSGYALVWIDWILIHFFPCGFSLHSFINAIADKGNTTG